MASLKTIVLSGLTLAVIATTPLTAHAIEVQCSTDEGSTCTVSNDPADSITCNCANGAGIGTSGANTWDGFDEKMLTEVCEAELDTCNFSDTEVGATSGGDSSTGSYSSTGYGSTGYDSTTYGGESSSSYGGESSSSTGGDTDGTSSSGGDPGTGSAGTTGSSTSGGNASSSSGGSGAGDSSGSSGTDLDGDDPVGCSVGGTQSGGALFAVFGLLLGLRRRR